MTKRELYKQFVTRFVSFFIFYVAISVKIYRLYVGDTTTPYSYHWSYTLQTVWPFLMLKFGHFPDIILEWPTCGWTTEWVEPIAICGVRAFPQFQCQPTIGKADLRYCVIVPPPFLPSTFGLNAILDLGWGSVYLQSWLAMSLSSCRSASSAESAPAASRAASSRSARFSRSSALVRLRSATAVGGSCSSVGVLSSVSFVRTYTIYGNYITNNVFKVLLQTL